MEHKAALMVAYASGLVTFWDMERCVRTHNLPLNPDVGPVLIGMKRRAEKGGALGGSSAEAASAPLPGSLDSAVNRQEQLVDSAIADNDHHELDTAADLDKSAQHFQTRIV